MIPYERDELSKTEYIEIELSYENSLVEFVKKLNIEMLKIPQECLGNAIVSTDNDEVNITYYRPENDTEYKERLEGMEKRNKYKKIEDLKKLKQLIQEYGIPEECKNGCI